MQSLFDESADLTRAAAAPLAARMRPRTLDEFVGQDEAVGPGTWLRRAIDADALSSVILYGPAGTGKTSLARIIAAATKARFEEVSAITGGVAELRKAIAAASDRLGLTGQRTILFIDEIHRFSKSQQDALLHAVEDRIVDPGRRDHREPVLRGQRAADQPLARGRAPAARRTTAVSRDRASRRRR